MLLLLPQVEHDGQVYNLRVLELQPEPAVSIVDTEMAADVGPSIETEGYMRAKAEAEAREAERQRQAQAAADKAAAEVRVFCAWHQRGAADYPVCVCVCMS